MRVKWGRGGGGLRTNKDYSTVKVHSLFSGQLTLVANTDSVWCLNRFFLVSSASFVGYMHALRQGQSRWNSPIWNTEKNSTRKKENPKNERIVGNLYTCSVGAQYLCTIQHKYTGRIFLRCYWKGTWGTGSFVFLKKIKQHFFSSYYRSYIPAPFISVCIVQVDPLQPETQQQQKWRYLTLE